MEGVADFVARVAARPEDFFAPSPDLAARLKANLKAVFDLSASAVVSPATAAKPQRGGAEFQLPLPELYVDGFDAEQLWSQLTLQQEPLMATARARLLGFAKMAAAAKAAAAKEAAAAAKSSKMASKKAPPPPSDSEEEDDEEDDEDEDSEAADYDDEDDSENASGSDDSDAPNDDDDEGAEEEGSDDDDGRGSVFSAGSMEAFCDEGDRLLAKAQAKAVKKAKKSKGKAASSEDDEDDSDDDSDDGFATLGINLNAPLPSDVEDEEGGSDLEEVDMDHITYEDMYGSKAPSKKAAAARRKNKGKAADDEDDDEEEEDEDASDASGDDSEADDNLDDEDAGSLRSGDSDDRFIDSMGHDFEERFKGGSDEEDEEDEDEEESGRPAKRRRVAWDDEDEDAGSEDEENDDDDAPVPASRHEQEKARLAAQVKQLEQEALAEKHWSLKGEINAQARPENSLLEAVLEVPQAMKLAPPVTVETTTALEDLIRQRIADAAWDDPVRKDPDAAVAAGVAKRGDKGELPDVSTEKAAGGLAEVYAADYAAQVMGHERAEDAAVKAKVAEAEALFAKVMYKLDQLGNLHFTPRPAGASGEPAAPSSAPAITMEEVLPMGVADGDVKAPEEVYSRGKGGRDGVLRSRGEMSAEEREAARRAKKASKRKAKKVAEAAARAVDRANPGMGNPHERAKALAAVAGNKDIVLGKGKAAAAAGVKRGRDGAPVAGAAAAAARLDAGAAVGDGTFSGAGASVGIDTSSTRFGNSTAFFAKLQEEAQRAIHAKTGGRGGGDGSGAVSRKQGAAKSVGLKM